LKINLSKILQQIYNSEIPVRIEFMYDMGFCWSLIDEKVFPRVFYDFQIEGVTIENVLTKDKCPVFEKDWLLKGISNTFEGAVKDLCESILKHLPDSSFSQWWRGIN
jgi:hypothetical protein